MLTASRGKKCAVSAAAGRAVNKAAHIREAPCYFFILPSQTFTWAASLNVLAADMAGGNTDIFLTGSPAE